MAKQPSSFGPPGAGDSTASFNLASNGAFNSHFSGSGWQEGGQVMPNPGHNEVFLYNGCYMTQGQLVALPIVSSVGQPAMSPNTMMAESSYTVGHPGVSDRMATLGPAANGPYSGQVSGSECQQGGLIRTNPGQNELFDLNGCKITQSELASLLFGSSLGQSASAECNNTMMAESSYAVGHPGASVRVATLGPAANGLYNGQHSGSEFQQNGQGMTNPGQQEVPVFNGSNTTQGQMTGLRVRSSLGESAGAVSPNTMMAESSYTVGHPGVSDRMATLGPAANGPYSGQVSGSECQQGGLVLTNLGQNELFDLNGRKITQSELASFLVGSSLGQSASAECNNTMMAESSYAVGHPGASVRVATLGPAANGLYNGQHSGSEFQQDGQIMTNPGQQEVPVFNGSNTTQGQMAGLRVRSSLGESAGAVSPNAMMAGSSHTVMHPGVSDRMATLGPAANGPYSGQVSGSECQQGGLIRTNPGLNELFDLNGCKITQSELASLLGGSSLGQSASAESNNIMIAESSYAVGHPGVSDRVATLGPAANKPYNGQLSGFECQQDGQVMTNPEQQKVPVFNGSNTTQGQMAGLRVRSSLGESAGAVFLNTMMAESSYTVGHPDVSDRMATLGPAANGPYSGQVSGSEWQQGGQILTNPGQQEVFDLNGPTFSQSFIQNYPNGSGSPQASMQDHPNGPALPQGSIQDHPNNQRALQGFIQDHPNDPRHQQDFIQDHSYSPTDPQATIQDHYNASQRSRDGTSANSPYQNNLDVTPPHDINQIKKVRKPGGSPHMEGTPTSNPNFHYETINPPSDHRNKIASAEGRRPVDGEPQSYSKPQHKTSGVSVQPCREDERPDRDQETHMTGTARRLFRSDSNSAISKKQDNFDRAQTTNVSSHSRNRSKDDSLDKLTASRTRFSPQKSRSSSETQGYRPLYGSGAWNYERNDVEIHPYALVRRRPTAVCTVEELDARSRLLGYTHTALFNAVMDSNEDLAALNRGIMAELRHGTQILREGFAEYQRLGREITDRLVENRNSVEDMKTEIRELRCAVKEIAQAKPISNPDHSGDFGRQNDSTGDNRATPRRESLVNHASSQPAQVQTTQQHDGDRCGNSPAVTGHLFPHNNACGIYQSTPLQTSRNVLQPPTRQQQHPEFSHERQVPLNEPQMLQQQTGLYQLPLSLSGQLLQAQRNPPLPAMPQFLGTVSALQNHLMTGEQARLQMDQFQTQRQPMMQVTLPSQSINQSIPLSNVQLDPPQPQLSQIANDQKENDQLITHATLLRAYTTAIDQTTTQTAFEETEKLKPSVIPDTSPAPTIEHVRTEISKSEAADLSQQAPRLENDEVPIQTKSSTEDVTTQTSRLKKHEVSVQAKSRTEDVSIQAKSKMNEVGIETSKVVKQEASVQTKLGTKGVSVQTAQSRKEEVSVQTETQTAKTLSAQATLQEPDALNMTSKVFQPEDQSPQARELIDLSANLTSTQTTDKDSSFISMLFPPETRMTLENFTFPDDTNVKHLGTMNQSERQQQKYHGSTGPRPGLETNTSLKFQETRANKPTAQKNMNTTKKVHRKAKKQDEPSEDVAQCQRDMPKPQGPHAQKKTPSGDETQGQREFPNPQGSNAQKDTLSRGATQDQREFLTPQGPHAQKDTPSRDETQGQREFPKPQGPNAQKDTLSGGVTEDQREFPTSQGPHPQKDTPSGDETQGQGEFPKPQGPNAQKDTPSGGVKQDQREFPTPQGPHAQRDSSSQEIAQDHTIQTPLEETEKLKLSVIPNTSPALTTKQGNTEASKSKVEDLFQQATRLENNEVSFQTEFTTEDVSTQVSRLQEHEVSKQAKSRAENAAMQAEPKTVDVAIEIFRVVKQEVSMQAKLETKCAPEQIVQSRRENVFVQTNKQIAKTLSAKATLPGKDDSNMILEEIQPKHKSPKVCEPIDLRADSIPTESTGEDSSVQKPSLSEKSVSRKATSLSCDVDETSRCHVQKSSKTSINVANYACDSLNAEATEVKNEEEDARIHMTNLPVPGPQVIMDFLNELINAQRTQQKHGSISAQPLVEKDQSASAQHFAEQNHAINDQLHEEKDEATSDQYHAGKVEATSDQYHAGKGEATSDQKHADKNDEKHVEKDKAAGDQKNAEKVDAIRYQKQARKDEAASDQKHAEKYEATCDQKHAAKDEALRDQKRAEKDDQKNAKRDETTSETEMTGPFIEAPPPKTHIEKVVHEPTQKQPPSLMTQPTVIKDPTVDDQPSKAQRETGVYQSSQGQAEVDSRSFISGDVVDYRTAMNSFDSKETPDTDINEGDYSQVQITDYACEKSNSETTGMNNELRHAVMRIAQFSSADIEIAIDFLKESIRAQTFEEYTWAKPHAEDDQTNIAVSTESMDQTSTTQLYVSVDNDQATSVQPSEAIHQTPRHQMTKGKDDSKDAQLTKGKDQTTNDLQLQELGYPTNSQHTEEKDMERYVKIDMGRISLGQPHKEPSKVAYIVDGEQHYIEDNQVAANSFDQAIGPRHHAENDQATSAQQHAEKDEATSAQQQEEQDEATSAKQHAEKDEATSAQQHAEKDQAISAQQHEEKDQATSAQQHAEKDEVTSTRHHTENYQTTWSQQKSELIGARMQVAELSLSDIEILIDFLKESMSAQAAVGRHRSAPAQQHAEEDQTIIADSTERKDLTSRPQPYVNKDLTTSNLLPREKDPSTYGQSHVQKDHTTPDQRDHITHNLSTLEKDNVTDDQPPVAKVQTTISHSPVINNERQIKEQSLLRNDQATNKKWTVEKDKTNKVKTHVVKDQKLDVQSPVEKDLKLYDLSTVQKDQTSNDHSTVQKGKGAEAENLQEKTDLAQAVKVGDKVENNHAEKIQEKREDREVKKTQDKEEDSQAEYVQDRAGDVQAENYQDKEDDAQAEKVKRKLEGAKDENFLDKKEDAKAKNLEEKPESVQAKRVPDKKQETRDEKLQENLEQPRAEKVQDKGKDAQAEKVKKKADYSLAENVYHKEETATAEKVKDKEGNAETREAQEKPELSQAKMIEDKEEDVQDKEFSNKEGVQNEKVQSKEEDAQAETEKAQDKEDTKAASDEEEPEIAQVEEVQDKKEDAQTKYAQDKGERAQTINSQDKEEGAQAKKIPDKVGDTPPKKFEDEEEGIQTERNQDKEEDTHTETFQNKVENTQTGNFQNKEETQAVNVQDQKEDANTEMVLDNEKDTTAEKVQDTLGDKQAEKVHETEEGAQAEKVQETVGDAQAEKALETVGDAQAEKVQETVGDAQAGKIQETVGDKQAEKAQETVGDAHAKKAQETVGDAQAEKAQETVRDAQVEKAQKTVGDMQAEKLQYKERETKAENVQDKEKDAQVEYVQDNVEDAQAEKVEEENEEAPGEKVDHKEETAQPEKVKDKEGDAQAEEVHEKPELPQAKMIEDKEEDVQDEEFRDTECVQTEKVKDKEGDARAEEVHEKPELAQTKMIEDKEEDVQYEDFRDKEGVQNEKVQDKEKDFQDEEFRDKEDVQTEKVKDKEGDAQAEEAQKKPEVAQAKMIEDKEEDVRNEEFRDKEGVQNEKVQDKEKDFQDEEFSDKEGVQTEHVQDEDEHAQVEKVQNKEERVHAKIAQDKEEDTQTKSAHDKEEVTQTEKMPDKIEDTSPEKVVDKEEGIQAERNQDEEEDAQTEKVQNKEENARVEDIQDKEKTQAVNVQDKEEDAQAENIKVKEKDSQAKKAQDKKENTRTENVQRIEADPQAKEVQDKEKDAPKENVQDKKEDARSEMVRDKEKDAKAENVQETVEDAPGEKAQDKEVDSQAEKVNHTEGDAQAGKVKDTEGNAQAEKAQKQEDAQVEKMQEKPQNVPVQNVQEKPEGVQAEKNQNNPTLNEAGKAKRKDLEVRAKNIQGKIKGGQEKEAQSKEGNLAEFVSDDHNTKEEAGQRGIRTGQNPIRKNRNEGESRFYQVRDPTHRSSEVTSEKTTGSEVNTFMGHQAQQQATEGNGRGRGRGRRPWHWRGYPHRSHGPPETMDAFRQGGPSTRWSGEDSYSMHSNQRGWNHRRRNRNHRRKHEEESGFHQARDPPQRSSEATPEKTTESDVNTSMDDQAQQKAKTGNGRGRGRGRRPWQWRGYPHRSHDPPETMGAFRQEKPSTMWSGEDSYSMHSNQSLDKK
ncbi:hypothetical protein PoB_001041900 [Plakobranchus ocellatus]|uniref:Uncharacterized protein n=1 Tax=Plakobranchus ocellatus TaxID=259542 RepID=A0AAV3YP59_9GAST|nr:hypothetical protein PoB_001041900 [Plakobranchus ocellatus]